MNLTPEDVRNQMMTLWKSTFHDSDEYINLVFNTYFDPKWVEYEHRNGEIIAAMLGISYVFSDNKCSINSDCNSKVKGLYLCGLSTKPEYRRMGLMSKLLERIGLKAYKNNIAFTFLIPANTGLSKYYRDRKYVGACFKYEYRYINGFDFKKLCGNLINDYVISEICLDDCVLNDITNYVNIKSSYNSYLNIVRNCSDMKAIVTENYLSNGIALCASNINYKIVGILFASKDDNSNWIVQELIYDDENVKYLLLDKLSEKSIKTDAELSENDSLLYGEIIVNTAIPEKQKQIFSPFVDEFSYQFSEGEIKPHNEEYLPETAKKMFAMARICKLSEILKFAASSCPGRKFSILVKQDDFTENRGLHEVENGIYTYTPIGKLSDSEIAELEKNINLRLEGFNLSVEEVAEFLWRHSSNNMLDDVIAIPNLPLNISLMLE